MTTLEEATQRLQRALQGLEAAAERRSGAAGPGQADLDAVRAENLRLQQTVTAVSGRLDQTISRIKQMMEA